MRKTLFTLSLFTSIVLIGCSYGHPVVGIFPDEDDEDSNSLLFLLAGLGLAAAISESGATPPCTPSGTVMIAATHAANGRLALFRCNRDGTGCVVIDASNAAGQGDNTGVEPNMVFDPVNSRLIVTARNASANDRLGYYRCNVDGTSCGYTDLTTGNDTGHKPSAGIDLVNNRLVTATEDSTGGSGHLGMHICNLNGTGCASTDVSTATGQGNFSGFSPVLVVDSVDQRLYTATNNNGASNTVGFFRCNLTAGGCSFTNISSAAGLGANSGFLPDVIHDQANGRNVFISRNGIGSPAQLGGFRCLEDGTGCNFLDVDGGQPINSVANPRSFLGPDNRIYSVAANPQNNSRTSLWRSDIDGANSIHANIGASLGAMSGGSPDVTADSTCAYAASNDFSGGPQALYYYYCRLDGTECQTVDLTATTGAGFGVSAVNILLL